MENQVECIFCGDTENVNLIEVKGEKVFICEECEKERIRKCCCCGDFFDIEKELCYVELDNGDFYCEDCKDEELAYCEHCESWQDRDETYYVDGVREIWCQSCIDYDAHICDECYQDMINNIHCYSYEPAKLNFLKTDSEKDKKCLPYLGFELESGGLKQRDIRRKIAEEISDDEETFYLKEDSSIPDYGFELVSHPITLKKHKELDWERIFNIMIAGGLKSHDLGEESCGLHVHVSRCFLTDFRWLIVDWFVSKYQSKWEIIARRKETHWARYKKTDGKSVKETYGKTDGTRYRAVNFENWRTVEFRLFRGTLKYTTFMATLEIVDALVHWANKVKVHDILEAGDAFKVFTKYIKENSELYNNAINYLESKNLM